MKGSSKGTLLMSCSGWKFLWCHSLAVCLPRPSSPFIPKFLKVHFIGLQSENNSLLMKHSVSFTVWLFFHALLSVQFLFCHQAQFFSVNKCCHSYRISSVKQRIYIPGYLLKLYSFKILESSVFLYRWLMRGWCSRK